MTATTHDYCDHVGHFGDTRYAVSLIRWENDEPNTIESREWATLSDAKTHAALRLAVIIGDVHVEIRRGQWQIDEFPDDEYGTVRDAEWREDETWSVHGWRADGGTIEWEEG